MKATYQEHLDYVNSVGIHSTSFFNAKNAKPEGYHLQQDPQEFAQFLEFMNDKPIKRYLEIGSASGGFIRCIYERLGFDYGVMIDDGAHQSSEQLKNIEAFKDKIMRHVPMNSHSEAAKEVLKREKPFDLIWIDGDHSYEGVLQDIDLVLPYAHKGTLIAFHDIRYNGGGVQKAYEEALASGKLQEVAQFVQPNSENPLGIGVTKIP